MRPFVSAHGYSFILTGDPFGMPMPDCLAILLFAFCGGVLAVSQEGMMNDPTSQANRYDVSVGWKFTKLQQLLLASSEAVKPHYPSPRLYTKFMANQHQRWEYSLDLYVKYSFARISESPSLSKIGSCLPASVYS